MSPTSEEIREHLRCLRTIAVQEGLVRPDSLAPTEPSGETSPASAASRAPASASRGLPQRGHASGPSQAETGSARLSRGLRVMLSAVVALQVLVPLSDYIGPADADERFAWRMFSTARLEQCRTRVDELTGGRWRPVDVAGRLHPAWRALLDRRRPAVEEAVLERVCTGGAARVRLARSCRRPGPDGRSSESRVVDCRPEGWGS